MILSSRIDPHRLVTAIAIAMLLMLLTGCQIKHETPAPLVMDVVPANIASIPQNSPAHWCPSEARFYLQFDHMAKWRSERADDPLVKHLWQTIAELRPKGMWDAAAKALNMDEAALTDRYFGECLAIIGEKNDTKTPYVIVSRVNSEYLSELPQIMPLVPLQLSLDIQTTLPAFLMDAELPFQTFSSKDGQLLFAVHDDWLFVAPVKFNDYFKSVLRFANIKAPERSTGFPSAFESLSDAPRLKSIVEDGQFQTLLAKLPRERDLFFYTRDSRRKNHHAAAVVMHGDQLQAHYVGTIDKMDDLYEQFEQGKNIDFGFMPRSTISAASLNLVKRDAKGLGALNLFVFPKSIEADVLPKLASPIVVFLSRVEGNRIKPDPGTAVPGLGIAIRMKDPDVANELSRIVGGLHFMADVSRLDLLGGIMGSRSVSKNGLTYRIADFGDALTKQIKDPESARMFKLPNAAGLTSLTYGRIGDWFVICSQESLYHECAAAYADESLRFTSSSDFSRYPFEDKERLIMSALTQAPQLAALTKELDQFWERMESQAKAQAAPADTETSKSAPEIDSADDAAVAKGSRRIRQPMEWIADAIKHRDSFYMQVWRDSEGNLRGQMSTVEQVESCDASSR